MSKIITAWVKTTVLYTNGETVLWDTSQWDYDELLPIPSIDNKYVDKIITERTTIEIEESK